MRHSKIKGMGKRNKRINLLHFATMFKESTYLPVCETKGKCIVTPFREEVTCKKCKASPQFLIHNFNSRFGIK